MPTDNSLHKAANKGDLELCIKLMEVPDDDGCLFDVNEPGASDRRPLHRSAGGGHLELCEYFLSKGAELEAIDKSGRTALHWAAISGHTEVVKMLLGKGANILAISTSGMNSLHMAVEAGRVDTVRALMEAIASDEEKKSALTTAKTSEDKTPWDIGAAAKNTAICQILKDSGDTNGASSSCILS